jgi:hypothetical protein
MTPQPRGARAEHGRRGSGRWLNASPAGCQQSVQAPQSGQAAASAKAAPQTQHSASKGMNSASKSMASQHPTSRGGRRQPSGGPALRRNRGRWATPGRADRRGHGQRPIVAPAGAGWRRKSPTDH